MLRTGALIPLLSQMTERAKLSFLRNATWAVSNLCRGKPQPPLEMVHPALGVLAQVIYASDTELLTDALWALSYLSDGDNTRVQSVVESGAVRRIVELMVNTLPAVATPALRTIGNIVTGDEIQTQVAINAGALPALLSLLTTGNVRKAIRKEACWAVSNVMAGTREQVQAVIDANLVQVLVGLMTSADFETRKEAAWALSNATSGGSPDQVEHLVRCGVLPALVEMMTTRMDTKIVTVALEGVDNILKAGSLKYGLDNNPFVQVAEEAGVTSALEDLQNLDDHVIYSRAAEILVKYFDAEEDDAFADHDAAGGGADALAALRAGPVMGAPAFEGANASAADWCVGWGVVGGAPPSPRLLAHSPPSSPTPRRFE